MNIQVHIDRLILEGVPVESARHPILRAAVEAEIGRLLIEQGLTPGLSTRGISAESRGSIIRPARSASVQEWGRQIGRAVYEGFSR
jgi:hypothetical protein